MPVTVDEMMAGLSLEDRDEVEQGAAEIVAASQSLRDIRKSLNLTQDELARALETSQANVAKIEGKSDLMVSTVMRVVEALGGRMLMVVNLPGRPTSVLTLDPHREPPFTAEMVLPEKPSQTRSKAGNVLTSHIVEKTHVCRRAGTMVSEKVGASSKKGGDSCSTVVRDARTGAFVVDLASRRGRGKRA